MAVRERCGHHSRRQQRRCHHLPDATMRDVFLGDNQPAGCTHVIQKGFRQPTEWQFSHHPRLRLMLADLSEVMQACEEDLGLYKQ